MLEHDLIARKNVDKVFQLLEKNNLRHHIITHGSVKIMEDVRRELPTVNPADMIKSILIEVNSDEKIIYILCGIPADRKLNLNILACVFNVAKQKIKVVHPTKVKEATSLEVGCLSPLLMPSHIKIYLDETFISKEELWCGIGTYNHSLKLSINQFKIFCSHFEFINLVD